jgi:hypothetical protein
LYRKGWISLVSGSWQLEVGSYLVELALEILDERSVVVPCTSRSTTLLQRSAFSVECLACGL